MSEENESMRFIKTILDGFAKTLEHQAKKTDKGFSDLTSAVNRLTEVQQTLIESSIESRKEHEYSAKEMDRLKTEQNMQWDKIRHLSDAILVIDEKVKNNSKPWANVKSILIGASSAFTAAVLIFILIPKG